MFKDSEVGTAIDSWCDMDIKGLMSFMLKDYVLFLETIMQLVGGRADMFCNVDSVILGWKLLNNLLHLLLFLILKRVIKTKDIGLLEDNLANMNRVVTRLEIASLEFELFKQ